MHLYKVTFAPNYDNSSMKVETHVLKKLLLYEIIGDMYYKFH